MSYTWYKTKEFVRIIIWAIKRKVNRIVWFKIAFDKDNKSFCYWIYECERKIEECEKRHYDKYFEMLRKKNPHIYATNNNRTTR